MKLQLVVVPKSSRDAVVGWIGDRLKLRVTAPPERGRANAAAERVLAEALGLPRRRVRLVGGLNSALKLVEIDGLAEAEVRRRLAPAGDPVEPPR